MIRRSTEGVNLGSLGTKMTDHSNVEEFRHHGQKHACQKIGFAGPVRMLGEKRFFLEAWQCLGEVHLRISKPSFWLVRTQRPRMPGELAGRSHAELR
jgi:hypothetical protein